MPTYKRDDGWMIQADELIQPVERNERIGYEGHLWWRRPVYETTRYEEGDFIIWASPYYWFRKRSEFLTTHQRVGE